MVTIINNHREERIVLKADIRNIRRVTQFNCYDSASNYVSAHKKAKISLNELEDDCLDLWSWCVVH